MNKSNQVKKDYVLMAVADLILKLNEREDTKCGWWTFDIDKDSSSMSVNIKFDKDQAQEVYHERLYQPPT